jgi:uncharacterized damage-inducible protein DinB
MAYQTIRDLVRHIRSLHHRLRDAVREAQARAEDSEDTEDERSALLLSVIDEHESALERAVELAEQEGGDRVLDTWLQFDPNAQTERALRQGNSAASMSRHELLTHVLETDNAIIRLYELVQGSSGSPSVQSFFASLRQIEDSAVRRAARIELEARDV